MPAGFTTVDLMHERFGPSLGRLEAVEAITRATDQSATGTSCLVETAPAMAGTSTTSSPRPLGADLHHSIHACIGTVGDRDAGAYPPAGSHDSSQTLTYCRLDR